MIKTSPNGYDSQNVLEIEDLVKEIQSHRKKGKIIGLCSGSFDLLHPGHITHLSSAKKKCDILVAGVARDSYTRKTRESKGRPIFNHYVRAFAVSQLKAVDYVVIDEDSVKLIEQLKPDVYIKGSDYIGKDIIEISAMKKIGGKVIYTEDEKLATTELIKYIKGIVE